MSSGSSDSSRSNSDAESDSACSSLACSRPSSHGSDAGSGRRAPACEASASGREASSCASCEETPRQLRSALRSPGCSAADQGARRAKSKSVSFKTDADGVTICTPPTAAALSLLAAGAPSVPYRPAARPLTQATPAPARKPCVPAVSAQAVAAPSASQAADASASAAPAAPACTTSHAVASRGHHAGATVPHRPAPASQPHTSTSQPHPAPTHATDRHPSPPRTVSSRSVRDAFEHPSPARQRVLDALAEARARHAHLGTTTFAENWPMPPEADEPFRREAEERMRQRAAAEARRRANRCERLVSAPALLVTQRDAEILKVTYAARIARAAAAAAAVEGSVSGSAGEELAQPSQARVGSSGGSASCAALLREVVAERMRLAELMVSQAGRS